MRRLPRLAVVVTGGLALLAAGCAGGPPAEIAVGPHDSGATVEVARGGQVTISLATNPTTGFSWQATEHGTLVLRGSHYEAHRVPPGLVGAGGTAVFEFEAPTVGVQRLVMTYAQHFDPSARPARTFTLTVRVPG